MILQNSFFKRPHFLPTTAGSRARPGRALAPCIMANKDQVLHYASQEAQRLKADIAALRASARRVHTALTRRCQRAVGKRELLLAEGNAQILHGVPVAVRQRALRGIRGLKTGAAAPKIIKHREALVGSWELIAPSAPASVGIRQMEDLSLGSVDWGDPTVRVRGVSRFFGDMGEFIETYTLHNTTELIERCGTFEALADRTIVVDLWSVTLTHPNGLKTTTRAVPPQATLDVCYIDDDFCLIGSRRDRAEKVQAWVKSDPSPLAW